MVSNIRLDFISNVNPVYIEKMTEIRKGFIAVDDLLQGMQIEASSKNNVAAARSIELARTANESACQSTIKSLCILGEVTLNDAQTLTPTDMPDSYACNVI